MYRCSSEEDILFAVSNNTSMTVALISIYIFSVILGLCKPWNPKHVCNSEENILFAVSNNTIVTATGVKN